MSRVVLFVDDDEANLVVCEATIGDEFTVVTESSPHRALEILRSSEVAVLVSDQRMPEMSGVELCRRAAVESPETIRILITAYSDLKAAIEAINDGQVRRYLKKPWEPEELATEIRGALEVYDLNSRLSYAEERLRETERVYSLGVVSAGLAHEVRNPLGWLSNNVDFLSETMAEMKATQPASGEQLVSRLNELEEALEDIKLGVRRIADIVKSVESPALQRTSAKSELVDLSEVVQFSLRLVNPEVRRRARIEVHESGPLMVVGSSTELSQIVTNLVINALQAVGSRQRSKNLVSLELTGTAEHVVLKVRDNGPGIPEGKRHRIFDPFFTTKTNGGTGLGLAISRTIAVQLGGQLEVENSPEGGACFALRLPAVSSFDA